MTSFDRRACNDLMTNSRERGLYLASTTSANFTIESLISTVGHVFPADTPGSLSTNVSSLSLPSPEKTVTVPGTPARSQNGHQYGARSQPTKNAIQLRSASPRSDSFHLVQPSPAAAAPVATTSSPLPYHNRPRHSHPFHFNAQPLVNVVPQLQLPAHLSTNGESSNNAVPSTPFGNFNNGLSVHHGPSTHQSLNVAEKARRMISTQPLGLGTLLTPQYTARLPLYAAWLLAQRGNTYLNSCGADGSLLFPFHKRKRFRTSFNPHQLMRLEVAFQANRYMVGQERCQLAKSLGLTETQIKVWFQNRRTKQKKDSGCLDNENNEDEVTSERRVSSRDCSASQTSSSSTSESDYIDVECPTVSDFSMSLPTELKSNLLNAVHCGMRHQSGQLHCLF